MLAVAVRCLTAIPDLCAPRVLWMGGDVTQPPSAAGDADNLLSVLLEVALQLAQVRAWWTAEQVQPYPLSHHDDAYTHTLR